jgi:hypothetical protein
VKQGASVAANENKSPWPESASELFRPSDRRLSAKLVPNFKADLYGRNLGFLERIRYSFFQVAPQLHSRGHEAEWTPFKIYCFSENLVAPGIEPGPGDLLSST